ncbi:MAG: alpha/beta hydrolase [Gammaproteobacteria bacterium]|nr:alpha/beta hydrolase [Gammaproteobacteria bacterium]
MTEQLEYIQRQNGNQPEYTVIWLHGLGADGYDFEPIVPALKLPADPVVRFVFPHAPMRPVTINGGMVMRAWYDISAMEMVRNEDAAGVEQSAAQVRDLIAEQNRDGIPTERIILAGFSQGGAIALHTGLRYAEALAGIMALSTYVPLKQRLAKEAHASNLGTSVFMAHGTSDPVIPLTLGDASRKLLQELGYPVEWRTYPMQHAVSPEEIDDIGRWLRARMEE